MATRDISVSIAVQGEKEFDQALRNAQSAVKVLSSELKASEAAFDENADAQTYFANRTRLINEQIDQQKIILKSLEQAVRDAGEEFGESSAKTDKYRIAVNKTHAEISKLERALRETQQEAEELGRDSTRIGRQMEEGIGDAADEISDKLDKMVTQIEQDLSDIGGAVEFSAFKDATDMVIGGIEQLESFVESSEDYRRKMSFLEQNALDSGFDFEYIKGQLTEIAALTGDADGAFEAISNLMAAGFDGKELEEAIGLIGGAVIRFPETMKFENLAESLQESISTGAATGAYAELLERLGVDLNTVNESLAKATTEEERQQIALAYLNEHGLKDTVDNYKSVNADLIASETAQLNFNNALAKLGESLAPAATAWTNFKTGIITGLTEMIESYKEWEKKLWAQNEEDKELIAKTVEESTRFSSIEEYTDAIARADAEGAYARANILAAERDKFLAEQAKKTAAELNTATQEDAATIGGNIVTGMENGIAEESEGFLGMLESLWQSANALLSGRPITIPVQAEYTGAAGGASGVGASSYMTGGTGSRIEVITEIDSETVAQKTVDPVSSMQGQQALREAVYG